MSDNEKNIDSVEPVTEIPETAKVKRPRKPKVVEDSDQLVAEVETITEVPVLKTEEEPTDVVTKIEAVEPIEEKSLRQKIADLATRSDARTVSRALAVHKAGGSVAVTKDGSLLFHPGKHPDKGGREALLRTGKVRVLIADI